MMLRKRIAGAKGLAYHKLSPSQRYTIDKAVEQRFGKNLDKLVGTISKRTLPMIRKKEMARLAKARGQKTSSIIGPQTMTQSYDISEAPDYISTNNDNLLTPKVNMLLRLGLVDQDEIERYRRALKIGEKALSSPELRGKILSMLDRILKLATDDPQTFARIRAMVVLRKNSQNEQNSLEVNPLEIDPLQIDKTDPTPDQGHSQHLTLRKKMVRQHEAVNPAAAAQKAQNAQKTAALRQQKIQRSLKQKAFTEKQRREKEQFDASTGKPKKTFSSMRNKRSTKPSGVSALRGIAAAAAFGGDKEMTAAVGNALYRGYKKLTSEYDPLAEDKIVESLYKKSMKYNVSIDTVVEVYEDALENSGNENVAFDAVNSFLANLELDEVQRSADVNRVKVRLPDGRIVWRNDRRATGVQDEEVAESHFKIGDKVKFKTSGMKGEVVKLDKEDGAEDEKYYTIKGEDGKMQKMAPKDMIKETEQIDEKHLVNVTISDPNHTMVSKRKETIQRRASVTAKDREHAIDTAINHYKKQGYKVHDHQYIEKKEKDFENTSPAPKVSKTSLYRDVKETAVRAVAALNSNPKMYKFIAPKGTPDSEPERNKAAAGLRKDRRRGPTGTQHYDVRREDVDTDSIFEIEMYVPEIHEARGDHLLTIQGGRGKGRKFMHKDTSVDDHLSAMEFHLKGYHAAKKDKLDATKNHHAKMYHKHKDQIEALGEKGNHLKESNAHKILAQKIQQIAVRKRIDADTLARHNAEQEKAEKEKKQGVAEAKADPLGSWISHKEFTDPKIFKTREGAKAHAEKTGGTVNSSEGYHKLRKEKKQGVTEASTPYWKKLSFIKKMSQMAKQERREREKKEAEKKPVKEEGGAGEFGTPELTKKYAKDTPGQCQEILNMNTSDMGDVIKDFKKSDAPQFKGKSTEKRRQMAIAAKLSSQDKE
jgi:hypothetical protein